MMKGCEKMDLIKRIGKGIALGTVRGTFGAVKNMVGTARDLYDAARDRDVERACNVVAERAVRGVKGVCSFTGASARLIGNMAEKHNAGQEVFDDDTVEQLIKVGACVGTIVVMGETAGLLFGDDHDVRISEAGLLPETPVDDIDGVENGVLIDHDGLDDIIREGNLTGTEHLEAGEYVRNIGVRDAFLHSHGFSEVPEGYDVHHIVPLCEGGADSPDNMVLVSKFDHAQATAAQAAHYGWHRG